MKSIKEFNLSEKTLLGRRLYSHEDVKEFINRLKEELVLDMMAIRDTKSLKEAEYLIFKNINKLAGDKLI